MFPGLLNQTCTISRMQPVAGDPNGNEALAVLYTNVGCNIQPLNTTSASGALLTELKFSLGQAYNAYFMGNQDIAQGDQLTVGSTVYNVKLVQIYNAGPASYIACMVELQES